jgi:hypothetical protein
MTSSRLASDMRRVTVCVLSISLKLPIVFLRSNHIDCSERPGLSVCEPAAGEQCGSRPWLGIIASSPELPAFVNAGLKGLFFSRFENDLLPGILPEEPQNRRIPNRRISKEIERSPIPTFDIRRS